MKYNVYSIVDGEKKLIGEIETPIISIQDGALGAIEEEIKDGVEPLKVGGDYLWLEQSN